MAESLTSNEEIRESTLEMAELRVGLGPFGVEPKRRFMVAALRNRSGGVRVLELGKGSERGVWAI